MRILNRQFVTDLEAGRPIRLDLGSGGKRKPGFYAVDHLALEGVDIVADLNQPLTLIPDQSVDHVYTRHVLEHIHEFLPLMREIHRVCKPDAQIEIIVPHFSNVYGFSDPTHVRFFGIYTMNYFVRPESQIGPRKVPAFYSQTRFELESVHIDFYRSGRIDRLLAGLFTRWVNRSMAWQDFYERRCASWFHAWQITFRMRRGPDAQMPPVRLRVRWWPFDPSPRIASTRIRCTRVIAGLRALNADAGLFDPADAPPDVLVLSKRYDDQTLQEALALRRRGTRLVLDLCDNLFHADTPSPAALQRAARLRRAVAAVDAVSVSTDAIAQVVRTEVPHLKALHVIGDAYEDPFETPDGWGRERLAAEYRLMRLRGSLLVSAWRSPARLLWFGHHGSAHAAGGMLDLLSVIPTLNQLAQEQAITLTVISNHQGKFRQLRQHTAFPSFYLPWESMSFSRAARWHDVALLPIQHNPFTVCKTNNRVATALLHGLAVVADPIPSYEEFSDHVMLGDWGLSLRRLCAQPQLRQQLVQGGLAHLQAHWSLPTVARAWLDMLEQVAARS